MSITGINSYQSSRTLLDLYGTQATDEASSNTSPLVTTTSTSNSKNDSLQLSGPAEIYRKLQELAKTDPEKLKAVCARIAEMLKSVSENDNVNGSNMLAELAKRFQQVADGGDVSILKPPEPPSSSGAAQGPMDKYSQQQAAKMIEFLNSLASQSNSDGSDGNQIFANILAEINKALAK